MVVIPARIDSFPANAAGAAGMPLSPGDSDLSLNSHDGDPSLTPRDSGLSLAPRDSGLRAPGARVNAG